MLWFFLAQAMNLIRFMDWVLYKDLHWSGQWRGYCGDDLALPYAEWKTAGLYWCMLTGLA